MFNKVILIGRLTADPEVRYTQSGTPVASFTLAVERNFTNQQGERETDFINIVVWNKLAENCANHIGKGRLVAVEGRLQIRSYDDSQGVRRKASEVVAGVVRFLDWPRDNGERRPNTENGNAVNNDTGGFGQEIDYDPEEIPF